MKLTFAAIAAALAFGGASLPAAPAQAHASNCTYFNGPYCEMAHNVRHHNWSLPTTWQQQPYYGGSYGGGVYGGTYGGGYGGCQGSWPSYGTLSYDTSSYYTPSYDTSSYTSSCYQQYQYPSYGQQPYAYPPATSQWQTPGTCQIESAFGCRFRSPSSYGYGYGY